MPDAEVMASGESLSMAALQLRLRLHAVLTRAVAAGADSFEELFRPCLQALGTALDAETVGIWTLADDGAHLDLRAACRQEDGTCALARPRIGAAHASSLSAAVSPALFHDPRFEEPLFSPPLSGPERHVLVAPLVAGARLLGVLAMCRAKRPTREDDEAFASVTDLIAIATDRQSAAEQLREREDGLGTLISTAPDGIVVLDRRSHILAVNRSLERIFGYEPGELIGENVVLLMPERFRARHNAGIRRYLETGQKRISWHGIELVGLHKEGTEFPIEISFGEYAHNGHTVFTGFIRDITERKRVEDRDRRRRRAIQTTAVYIGSALVTLQAADLILPVLPLPAWSFRALVLLALAGLPLVLGVGWGWRGAAGEAVATRSPRAAWHRPLHWLAYGGLVILLVATAAFLRSPVVSHDAGAPVVAVLPFDELDDSALTRQLARGVAEDIITAVGELDAVRVVSRTSVSAHAGHNRTIAQIGRELQAEFVLEGSVRRAGDRIRVSVRLTRAGPDRQIWAATFDRQVQDSFAVQEELAGTVAGELSRRLAPAGVHTAPPATTGPTDDT